jgi:hypothetical protein
MRSLHHSPGKRLFSDAATACDAKTHHGFLGVENKAVKKITKRMDQILKAIKKRSVKE